MRSVFWSVLIGTIYRYFQVALRAYPYSFLIGNVLTGLYTVGLGYLTYYVVFGGQVSVRFRLLTGSGDYLSYIVVGAGCYLVVVRTLLNVGRSLITEQREGTLESLFISPASRMAYLIGNMVAQTMTTLGEAALLLVLSLPLGLHLPHLASGAALVALLLALTSTFGLALLLAAVMLYTRDTYLVQNTLFALISLLCGISFPVEYLPRWIGWLGELVPVTWALRALRGSLLLGQDLHTLAGILTVLAAQTLLYLALGAWLIRRVERSVAVHLAI